jgi:NADH-quinone oxidoreductase subunit J
VFEVIIYAGAIMVLFLFVIMMLDLGHPEKMRAPGRLDWWPALFLGLAVFASFAMLASSSPDRNPAAPGGPGIRDLAVTMYRNYGIAVEIVSFQLLFALVGSLYLGRRK